MLRSARYMHSFSILIYIVIISQSAVQSALIITITIATIATVVTVTVSVGMYSSVLLYQ